MKWRHKIALLSICLALTLPWVGSYVCSVLQSTTEKKIIDHKEALPESELDSEDKSFELVHEFLPSPTTHFQVTSASISLFGNNAGITNSLHLEISNPPPELKFIA